jgi:hypothetical protein
LPARLLLYSLYAFFAQSQREERLHGRIAIAMQDGGAREGARHEAAARAARPTPFCLAAERL